MAYPYQVNMGLSRSIASSFAPITYVANGTPVDLTSANANMTFQNVSTGLTDLTLTVGQGITLGGTAGTINIALTSTQAAALSADQYIYSLNLDLG